MWENKSLSNPEMSKVWLGGRSWPCSRFDVTQNLTPLFHQQGRRHECGLGMAFIQLYLDKFGLNLGYLLA